MFLMRALAYTPYLWFTWTMQCLTTASYTLESPTARKFARWSRSKGMSRTLLHRS